MLGTKWQKSTRSNGSGACVEARWRKSSYSGGSGNCVEARDIGGLVEIADTKDPATRSAPLAVSPAAWVAFLRTVR